MDKDYRFTGYNRSLKESARVLRKSMTPQERRLWYHFLRDYPIKWYRQRAIDRFIVDFYCPAAKLVIELDGSQHYSQDGLAHDAERTAVLSQYGLIVLRFSNQEISQNFSSVCESIHQTVSSIISTETR